MSRYHGSGFGGSRYDADNRRKDKTKTQAVEPFLRPEQSRTSRAFGASSSSFQASSSSRNHHHPATSSSSSSSSSRYWPAQDADRSATNEEHTDQDVLDVYNKCLASLSSLQSAPGTSSPTSLFGGGGGDVGSFGSFGPPLVNKERSGVSGSPSGAVSGGVGGALSGAPGGALSGGPSGALSGGPSGALSSGSGGVSITPPLRSLAALSAPAVLGAAPSSKPPLFLKAVAEIMFSVKMSPFDDDARIVRSAFEIARSTPTKDLGFEDGKFFVSLSLDGIILSTSRESSPKLAEASCYRQLIVSMTNADYIKLNYVGKDAFLGLYLDDKSAPNGSYRYDLLCAERRVPRDMVPRCSNCDITGHSSHFCLEKQIGAGDFDEPIASIAPSSIAPSFPAPSKASIPPPRITPVPRPPIAPVSSSTASKLGFDATALVPKASLASTSISSSMPPPPTSVDEANDFIKQLMAEIKGDSTGDSMADPTADPTADPDVIVLSDDDDEPPPAKRPDSRASASRELEEVRRREHESRLREEAEEEERKKREEEEIRKREEARKKRDEERKKREEEAREQQEKKREEELKKREKEAREKREEEAREEQKKKRAEELKKREEERKKLEEEAREEQRKKTEEERRKTEEKRRKTEEERQKREEERMKREEERKKREEESKKEESKRRNEAWNKRPDVERRSRNDDFERRETTPRSPDHHSSPSKRRRLSVSRSPDHHHRDRGSRRSSRSRSRSPRSRPRNDDEHDDVEVMRIRALKAMIESGLSQTGESRFSSSRDDKRGPLEIVKPPLISAGSSSGGSDIFASSLAPPVLTFLAESMFSVKISPGKDVHAIIEDCFSHPYAKLAREYYRNAETGTYRAKVYAVDGDNEKFFLAAGDDVTKLSAAERAYVELLEISRMTEFIFVMDDPIEGKSLKMTLEKPNGVMSYRYDNLCRKERQVPVSELPRCSLCEKMGHLSVFCKNPKPSSRSSASIPFDPIASLGLNPEDFLSGSPPPLASTSGPSVDTAPTFNLGAPLLDASRSKKPESRPSSIPPETTSGLGSARDAAPRHPASSTSAGNVPVIPKPPVIPKDPPIRFADSPKVINSVSNQLETDLTYASNLEKIVSCVMLDVKLTKIAHKLNAATPLYGKFASAENFICESLHEHKASSNLVQGAETDSPTVEWTFKIGLQKLKPNIVFHKCLFTKQTPAKEKSRIFFEGLFWKICSCDYLGTTGSTIVLANGSDAKNEKSMFFRYDTLCKQQEKPGKTPPPAPKASAAPAPRASAAPAPVPPPPAPPSRAVHAPAPNPPSHPPPVKPVPPPLIRHSFPQDVPRPVSPPRSDALSSLNIAAPIIPKPPVKASVPPAPVIPVLAVPEPRASPAPSPKPPAIPSAAPPRAQSADDESRMKLGPKSDLALVAHLKSISPPNYATQSRVVPTNGGGTREEWIAVVRFGNLEYRGVISASKSDAQNSAAFAALEAGGFFKLSKFPLHDYSLGGPLLVLKNPDDDSCLTWYEDNVEAVKAFANMMFQMKKLFGFLHGISPLNEGYEKRLGELFKMDDLSAKFSTVVNECNTQGFLKLNPSMEVDNFDWIFKFNEIVFEAKNEVIMMPKMKNKFHRSVICTMVRCDYLKISSMKGKDGETRPRLMMFDAFTDESHGAVRYDCLFDPAPTKALAPDPRRSESPAVPLSPVQEPARLPLNPLNESSPEMIGVSAPSLNPRMSFEVSMAAIMFLVKSELSRTFPDSSMIHSDAFPRLFERLCPDEKVSDMFVDLCRKCDVFVSVEAIPRGWSFLLNGVKVMDKFAPSFAVAQRDFHRQIMGIFLKSDFVKVDTLYQGAKFVSFHESYLNAPNGAARYDFICRQALTSNPASASLAGSEPLLTEALRELLKKSIEEMGKKKKKMPHEEEMVEPVGKEKLDDAASALRPAPADDDDADVVEIRTAKSKTPENTRDKRTVGDVGKPAPSRSPSAEEEIAAVEPTRPPLPKFVAEVGPKVVGGEKEPTKMERRVAEAMLSVKLRFIRQFKCDVHSYQIGQISDPKPDYEQILKDEFLSQDLHFEANVSDCSDEGKFIFELIIFPKCGHCVFECSHHVDDKILAFRSLLTLEQMVRAKEIGYVELAVKLLRSTYLLVKKCSLGNSSTAAKLLMLYSNQFDAEHGSFRYDHLTVPRYPK